MLEGETNDFKTAMELSNDWYQYDKNNADLNSELQNNLYVFGLSGIIARILLYQSSHIKAKYYFGPDWL